jgi:hypothetical protein
MPIFVQWKWAETRKSFLVVFHFYDDFSKPNLRIRKYSPVLVTYEDEGVTNRFMDYPMMITYADLSKGESIIPEKAWMTWAPSHIELALLSELLSYANIINGLNEIEKVELKSRLEAREDTTLPYGRQAYRIHPDIVNRIGKDKKVAICDESLIKQQEPFICVELCPEYIDYLRNVLKPHLTK